MLQISPDEFDAVTRLDFQTFVERVFAEIDPGSSYLDNFHIGVLAGKLEAVRRGDVRRLAIALPPRSLKSIVVSVALPAWLLGHNPSAKIICASYGQQLADKHAQDCRQVMQSAWYRRLFPRTRLVRNRQAVAAYETTAGGMRFATSVGGVLTGFGADIIIVDDPTKPDEALSDAERTTANMWARHTLFTRLNDKVRGSIIIVMQRLHEDDLIGHVMGFSDFELVSFAAIAQEDEEHVIESPLGRWRHRRREGDALHPEREPLTALEQLRVQLGTRFFSAQYLQQPSPPGGSLVKAEWFQRYDPAHCPEFEEVIQSWDTASRANQLSDHSVCTSWGRKGQQYFLLNVVRKRLEYPALKRQVISQSQLFEASTVLIEDAASGIALIQDLTNDGFSLARAIKPLGDKVMRMQAQTGMIEAGRVFIPSSAAWLDDYLHELMMFPHGKYDDQVDSTSQALAYFASNVGFANLMAVLFREDDEDRHIRLNHEDKERQFILENGRCPPREADGSFLVSAREYRPLEWTPGLSRIFGRDFPNNARAGAVRFNSSEALDIRSSQLAQTVQAPDLSAIDNLAA